MHSSCTGLTEALVRRAPAVRTFQVTSDAVARLVEAGVVRQVTLGRRNRAFEAVGLFEAFTGFERALASPEVDTSIAPPARPVPARPPTP